MPDKRLFVVKATLRGRARGVLEVEVLARDATEAAQRAYYRVCDTSGREGWEVRVGDVREADRLRH